MGDLEVRESEALALPGTGVVVDLGNATEVARAYDDLAMLQKKMYEAQRVLAKAFAEQTATLGSKTIDIGRGLKARLSGGPEKHYDAEAIRDELREAGMPEERISQIVQETISYKVKAIEANRAARANPAYASIVERNTTEVERSYRITVGRS